MDIIFPTIVAIAALYYGQVHFSFWYSFKTEAPEVYRKHANYSPTEYTCGFQWVDFALSKKYEDLNNPKISKTGETLFNSYIGYRSIIGLSALLLCISWAIWAICFIINQA